jgi:hypothetical protein
VCADSTARDSPFIATQVYSLVCSVLTMAIFGADTRLTF